MTFAQRRHGSAKQWALTCPRSLRDSGGLMRLDMMIATKSTWEICKSETQPTSASGTCTFSVANQSHGTFVSDRRTSPHGS
eukprot:6535266-Pyramimonas_sp.AAC.2